MTGFFSWLTDDSRMYLVGGERLGRGCEVGVERGRGGHLAPLRLVEFVFRTKRL